MNPETPTSSRRTKKEYRIGWIVAWSISITVALALLALPTLSVLIVPLVISGSLVISVPVMIVGIVVLSRVSLGTPLVLTSICAGGATIAFSALESNALYVLSFEMSAISMGLWVFSRISPVIVESSACAACGYSLAGLASNSACPECGQSNDTRTDSVRAIRILPAVIYVAICSILIIWSATIEIKSHTMRGLLQQLGSSDMQARWEAAEELGRRYPDRAIDIAYTATNPNQRFGAVLAVALATRDGSIAIDDAAKVLLDVLTSDTDKWIRLEAITRLQMFADDRNATAQIRDVLRSYIDPDSQVNNEYRICFG